MFSVVELKRDCGLDSYIIAGWKNRGENGVGINCQLNEHTNSRVVCDTHLINMTSLCVVAEHANKTIPILILLLKALKATSKWVIQVIYYDRTNGRRVLPWNVQHFVDRSRPRCEGALYNGGVSHVWLRVSLFNFSLKMTIYFKNPESLPRCRQNIPCHQTWYIYELSLVQRLQPDIMLQVRYITDRTSHYIIIW